MPVGTKLNVQVITEGQKKGPYIGTAVVRAKGIVLHLDPGKPVAQGARLFLTERWSQPETEQAE